MNYTHNKKTSTLLDIISSSFSKNDNKFSFTSELFYQIDKKGLTDVEVYTKANIDRKLFSKIRRNGYIPKRTTIIQLILAIELNYNESINLLNLAGFTLSTSPSMPFDIIISNAISNGIYDIDEINENLIKYQLPLLGL